MTEAIDVSSFPVIDTKTGELITQQDAESRQMALLEQAWKALAEANTFTEFKTIRDQAIAAKQLMRKRGMSLETQNEAAKITLAAGLRMGGYLRHDLEKAKGTRGNIQQVLSGGSTLEPPDEPTYRDLGIAKATAFRLQRLYDWEQDTDGVSKAIQEIQEKENKELIVSKLESKAVTYYKRKSRVNKIIEISQGNAELNSDITYPVIYADPPWQYDHQATENRAIENQYPTMDIDSICALPVAQIAAPSAILFLWATSPKLEHALRVIKEWGFNYVTCAIWDKVHIGQGYYFRQQHELLLVANRGDMLPPEPHTRPPWSIWQEKRGEHSAKPDKFAEIIEAMYPEFPKIELFCRSPRPGWAVWGNQSC